MSDDFPGFENDFQNSVPDEEFACCGNPLRGCKECPPPLTKKLTFEEWYSQQFPHGNYYSQETIDYFKVIWKAAQENK